MCWLEGITLSYKSTTSKTENQRKAQSQFVRKTPQDIFRVKAFSSRPSPQRLGKTRRRQCADLIQRRLKDEFSQGKRPKTSNVLDVSTLVRPSHWSSRRILQQFQRLLSHAEHFYDSFSKFGVLLKYRNIRSGHDRYISVDGIVSFTTYGSDPGQMLESELVEIRVYLSEELIEKSRGNVPEDPFAVSGC